MESFQFFFGKDLEPPEICRLPGWGKKKKGRNFFLYSWGAKKKKTFFLPPFHSCPNVLRERACPKEPKSEVLAIFACIIQFYEMDIYGWISLVTWTSFPSPPHL